MAQGEQTRDAAVRRLLFKVTNLDGTPCHGGSGCWPLPTQRADGTWIPGAPVPALPGPLVPCERGYHYCTAEQLVRWLGPAIHLVQHPVGMEEQDAGDKRVGRGPLRLERTLTAWTPRIQRHFAADGAAHVLHLNPDPRCAQAILTARRYADGRATGAELAAAEAAAWDAAGDAAWAAAGAAGAAWAARAAAWAAAGAAWAAAGAAERQWQTDRLLHYLRGGEPESYE